MTLSPDFALAMSRSRLLTRHARASLGTGSRKSRDLGAGTDFAEFRPFAEGDTTRFIDPRLYARSGKFFVRQFEVERQLPVTIMVDASASMLVPDQNKFSHSKRLTAALAFVALAGGDAVRLVVGNRASKIFAGPRNHASLTAWLEAQAPQGGTDFGLHGQSIAAESLVIAISDFLVDDPAAAVAPAAAKGAEIWALQVLAPNELDLSGVGTGPMTLEDAETGQHVEIDVSPALIERYQAEMQAHQQMLADSVARIGGRYWFVGTDSDAEHAIRTQGRQLGFVH